MAKLWEKNYSLNELIETFTVGNDYVTDLDLVAYDCVASIAHAKMLNKIGLLTDKSANNLVAELKNIYEDSLNKKFVIKKSDEDCHTAIEMRLTEKLGDDGKKIHTGRSRNDQVLTCSRLQMKAFLIEFINELNSTIDTILKFAKVNKNIPMVGRTHLQSAMPSSVGLWASSFAEELIDNAKNLISIYDIIDQNPLGAAASYGTPLPLDREYTTSLLGFAKVQNNVLYANNSRGKFEALVLEGVDNVILTFSKIATDLILFSLPEFGYFSLPNQLCSGSSIMPQKKNPDALELMRAKSATISAEVVAIKNIVRSLPSGYNRDFQETKEHFIKASKLSIQCVKIIDLTFKELKVNNENLLKAFTPDIFATDIVFDLVKSGKSFRDAYKEIGLNLDKLSNQDPHKTIKNRVSSGTAGNLKLNIPEGELKKLLKKNSLNSQKFSQAIINLTSSKNVPFI